MHNTSDSDGVLGANESDLAVRMLAEVYKRVPGGERLPTLVIDRRKLLQGAMPAASCWSPAAPPVSEPGSELVSEPGEPGLHRRRGVKGRLHVARTVRVRARRVLGAAAVIGVVTGLSLTAVLGLTRSGGSAIPSFQKPANPFLHSDRAKPDSGTGAVGSRRPPHGVSLGQGAPVAVRGSAVVATGVADPVADTVAGDFPHSKRVGQPELVPIGQPVVGQYVRLTHGRAAPG